MLRTRFNGTEATPFDKVIKLAGNKNPIAQGILNKMWFYTCQSGNTYLSMVDVLGLYGNRIELLFNSCGRDIANFSNTVCTLCEKNVPQDRIIAMKTQEEFDILFEECQQ